MTSYSRTGVQSSTFRNVILTSMLAGSVLGGPVSDVEEQTENLAPAFPRQSIHYTGVLGASTPSFNFSYAGSKSEVLEEIMGQILLKLKDEADSLTFDMERILFNNRMALYEA